jgi:CubicO group peptidase (beta-lactamase class C family)
MLVRTLGALVLGALAVANMTQGVQRLDRKDLSKRLKTMEQELDAKRAELGVPGLALVIVEGDKVIYMKGLGVRDVQRRLPVTPDTLFPIASATKAFTAALTAMSVDDHKLSFDDSPKKYLPYFHLSDSTADAEVTIRDLLCHRTGLMGSDLALGSPALNREEVIKVAGTAKPTENFRESFQYHNGMFSAAGEAVASAQKSTWDELVRRRIFQPLGMQRSNTSLRELKLSRDTATGYISQDEEVRDRKLPFRDVSNVASAGAINSSVRDMAQWLRLMLNNGSFAGRRLISEESFKQLVTPQIQMDVKMHYGLGWVLFDWHGYNLVSHDGGVDGFHSVVELMPDHQLGYVLLANVDDDDLEKYARKIIWSNLVGLPQPAAASGSASSESFNELVGRFEDRADKVSAFLEIEDGKLVLKITGQPSMTLEPKKKDQFTIQGAPESYLINIERGPRNEVVSLQLKEPDDETRFERSAAFVAPLSVDELMSKVVSAYGGAAALEKHQTMISEIDVDFVNQGMKAEGQIAAKAPDALALNLKLLALGKQVGTIYDDFDGHRGIFVSSFSPTHVKTGEELQNARIQSDFYQQALNWKKLFHEIAIKEISKVGSEEVYVVSKKPHAGSPITDYISTTNFRLLRRDIIEAVGEESGVVSEYYRDFRTVDGVVLPFTIIQQSPDFGKVTTTIKSIKFNLPLPPGTFKNKRS